MIRIARNPHGPRLYIFGLRCHHGVYGAALALVAYAARRRRLAAAFFVYAASDWRDFPFTDRCNH